MSYLKRLWLIGDAGYRLLFKTGLARSIWTGQSRDHNDNSVPWLSYAAIHYLDSLELTGAHVFEFGSGNSTLYWQRQQFNGQIKTYQGLEQNPDYYKMMAKQSRFYKDHVRLVPDTRTYIKTADAYSKDGAVMFDVTVVDGDIYSRHLELDCALRITDSEGIIIVDDANWLADQIEASCNKHAMFRVDFVSFGPCVSYPKMTSILFRNPARFFGARIRHPVGGMERYPGQF